MATRRSITFTVPPEMHRLVERIRRSEQRSVTELMREALRYYFARVQALPAYTPTPRELRAIEKGREAIRRGNFVTLDQLNDILDRKTRGPSPQKRRTRSAS